MLSPEDIKKLDDAGLGGGNVSTDTSQTQSLNERLGIKPQVDFQHSVIGGVVDNIKKDFAPRGQAIQDANNAYKKGDQTLAETIMTHASNIIGGAGDVLGETVFKPVSAILGTFTQPIVKAFGNIGEADYQKTTEAMFQVSKSLSDQAFNVLTKARTETDPNKKAKLKEAGQNLMKASQEATNAIDKYEANLGRGIRGVEAIRDVAPWLLGGIEGKTTPENVIDTTKAGVEKGVDITKTVVDKTKDISGKIIDKTGQGVDLASGKITGYFKGKTPEEILATPEDKVQKLSPSDRKVYFDFQKEQVSNKSLEMENKIKTESDKKITDIQSKNQDLKNHLDRASIEEAQNLKPQVQKSFSDNSKIYRDLIKKELDPVKDTEVTHEDIWNFVKENNLENPQKAESIANTLGLKDKGVTTIGEIYDNMKTLKQDIGKSAKKGSRVYTPDEIKTTDAISAFSNFLKKEKGIDFSEANSFWSKYAPLRDKVIKYTQPFSPRGTESGSFETFTKDIQKSLRGNDEGNADFIKATENLIGKKIGNSKTRLALEKLTDNEKAKVNAELERLNKITEQKLNKEKELNKIDDKEFEANRKAQTRSNILKAFGAIVGGGIALEEIKRLLGL